MNTQQCSFERNIKLVEEKSIGGYYNSVSKKVTEYEKVS
jgi:hypothetical protein